MADLSDVQTALVNLIAAALYPNGTGQPSAAGGIPCMVYPGWPIPRQLDTDLAAGKVHVSVYPRAEERNTTRFPDEWQQLSMNAATLTLTVNGQQVAVGGVVPPPNNPHTLTVLVNGRPYVYAVQAGDTLGSIAGALTALIVADVPSTAAVGAVVTVPAPARIQAARVGVTGTAIREVRRQERQFQISVWANTPASRDAVVKPVDAALAVAKFLAMPDGTAARVVYRNSTITDASQKAGLYRRDLIYLVEYATTQTETQTQINQLQIGVTPTNAPGTTYYI